jgi:hypothetical protein
MVPDISLIDETFDTNITSSYFLSIQVCLDGFSFCTLDPIRNKYIQFKYFSFSNPDATKLASLTEKIFEQNDLLNLPYKKVFILIPSPLATLVPTGLFNQTEAPKWIEFTHQVPSDHEIIHTRMKLTDAWNIFAVPKRLKELFMRQYPDPVFLHQYVPMTETKLAVSRPGSGRSQVIINLQDNYFDLVVLEKNNLKLCNTFKIKEIADLIYYTLFVFDQLQLIPASTETLVIGTHPEQQKITETLRLYLKHIKQPDLPGGFQYSYLFKEIPRQRFYNLLSLAACV